MIIWSGHGYIVAVIVFVTSLVMEFATETMTGNGQFYQQNAWALPAAMLLAAGITFAVERLAFASDSGHHALFFVPIKWWPLIIIGLAVLTLGHRLVN